MSNFDGRPLVAGTFVGVRTFRASGDRLRGMIFPVTFADGENIAYCAVRDTETLLATVDYAAMTWREKTALLIGIGMHSRSAQVWDTIADLDRMLGRPDRRPPHTVAGLSCTCGFYAYTSDPAARLDITPGYSTCDALIEGYGTCTAGSKGFRASKARLVALIDPPEAIAAAYDVPVYGTREAALAEHPLTSVAAS